MIHKEQKRSFIYEKRSDLYPYFDFDWYPAVFDEKKEWKIPALEVLMRLFYGIALIIGIVMMNVHGIAALALVHKICCGLFMALVVVLFVIKLATKKEK